MPEPPTHQTHSVSAAFIAKKRQLLSDSEAEGDPPVASKKRRRLRPRPAPMRVSVPSEAASSVSSSGPETTFESSDDEECFLREARRGAYEGEQSESESGELQTPASSVIV